MGISPSIPTIKDELNRKALETLDFLVRGVEEGRLTKEQASTGLDALFMAVNGLIDSDFAYIMAGAESYVAGAKSVVKKHFRSPTDDEVISLTWDVGSDVVVTCKRVCGLAVDGGVRSFDTARKAAKFMDAVSISMKKKGWGEL